MIMGLFFEGRNENSIENNENGGIGGIGSISSVGSEDSADSADEELAEQKASDGDDYYDGSTIRDVFKNYDKVRKGEGYYPIHFVETRKYLQQVRDQKRHIQLLEERIQYRRDAGLDTSWHEEELEQSRKKLIFTIAEVSEEISKVKDVNQEVVMTRRYIDLMSWDEIAQTADLKMRTVQKCHGHALPCMQEILLADGLIVLNDAADAADDADAGDADDKSGKKRRMI